jgi:hypothetical protein
MVVRKPVWIAFPLSMAVIFLGVSLALFIGLAIVAPPDTSYRKRLIIGGTATSFLGLFMLAIAVGTWLFPPRG